MREAIRAPEAAALAGSPLHGVIAGDAIAALAPAQARYRARSAAALAAAFPALRASLGEALFGRLAEAYLDRHPPAGPCLLDHGATLPPFLAGFAPARTQCTGAGSGHLAELARLDWVVHRVRHAADAPRLDPACLLEVPPQRLGDAVFTLASDLACVKSSWPLDRLRARALGETEAAPQIPFEEGGVRLFIQRRDAQVAIRRASPAEYAFVAALAVGRRAAEAGDAAFGCDACFAPQATLTWLFASGGFTAVRFPDRPTPGDRP